MTDEEYFKEMADEVDAIITKLEEIMRFRNQVLDLCEATLIKIAEASNPLGARLEEIAAEITTRNDRVLN